MNDGTVSGQHATIFGLISGALSTMLPDSLHAIDRVIVAMPVAFVSGLTYAAGAALWRRIAQKHAEIALSKKRTKSNSHTGLS